MGIQHGWNAHFQDDILTVMEDDGISILCWMFVSLIFNSVRRGIKLKQTRLSFRKTTNPEDNPDNA